MEGKKRDSGKLRYDLLPPFALEEVVKVYTMGANKYGDQNYRLGLNWGRVYAAMQRHLEAWRKGEERDPEGQLHLASVAWGALTLMEYGRMRQEYDDRPKWWDEQWKRLEKIPSKSVYEISNLGRIRRKGKILKPQSNGVGYYTIAFYEGGKRKRLYIHRLVAEAFLGSSNGQWVNHRDGNRGNNALANLEYLDAGANILDSYRSGRRKRVRPGSNNGE